MHFTSCDISVLSLGLFQVGDGTLIALWSAVFAHRYETNQMWEICADHIRLAGSYTYKATCITISITIDIDECNSYTFVIHLHNFFFARMQGLETLYTHTVHFRDRHTGCNVFEAQTCIS